MPNAFRTHILNARFTEGGNVAPVRTLGATTFLYLRSSDVYVLGVTASNANAMLAMQFMAQVSEHRGAWERTEFGNPVVGRVHKPACVWALWLILSNASARAHADAHAAPPPHARWFSFSRPTLAASSPRQRSSATLCWCMSCWTR